MGYTQNIAGEGVSSINLGRPNVPGVPDTGCETWAHIPYSPRGIVEVKVVRHRRRDFFEGAVEKKCEAKYPRHRR
jgi:hypothetical protein